MKKGVGIWAQDPNSLPATSPHPLPDRISTSAQEGGAQDEVGTLILRTHPTWGILAKYEQKGWSQDWKA